MIRIELESTTDVYRPGELVVGRVVWEMLKSVPKKLIVRIGWQTEGKGDDDMGITEESEWVPAACDGKESFRFKVPRGPLSLDGKLIRIHWFISAETVKPNEKVSRNIVVGYQSTPIMLNEVTSK